VIEGVFTGRYSHGKFSIRPAAAGTPFQIILKLEYYNLDDKVELYAVQDDDNVLGIKPIENAFG